MERYLVTGGAGFIGSHLVEALLRQGHFVRVLDNFDTGSRDNLASCSGPMEVMEGTIEDPLAVRKAIKGIDYVLHQAARGSVPRSISDPAGTHNVNVAGTLQVLIAARDAGVKRVVCASSSSVYGETSALPNQEEMLPCPQSPYAAGKLTLEHYCSVFSKVYGLETLALRYFNIYGPRQNPNLQYAAVIPIFVHNMLKDEPCEIYGDGEQTRDFTHVGDCVRANLLACKAKVLAGGVLNIACGAQTSVNQLFRLLSEMIGYIRSPKCGPARPGDVRHSYADITNAQRGLGYQPQVSLEEGLRRTVEWYRSRDIHTR